MNNFFLSILLSITPFFTFAQGVINCLETSPLITFNYEEQCTADNNFIEFSAELAPNNCLLVSNISTYSNYFNSPPHPYPSNNFAPGQKHGCAIAPTGSAVSFFQDRYAATYSEVAGSFHSIEFQIDSQDCEGAEAVYGFEISADVVEYAEGSPTKWFLRVLRNSLQVYVKEEIAIASLDEFQGHLEDFTGNDDFTLNPSGSGFTTFRFDFLPYAEDGSNPWNALNVDFIKIYTEPLVINDSDNDSICDDEDCQPNNPNLPTEPGTSCDDENAMTTDDVILEDGCTCEGELLISSIEGLGVNSETFEIYPNPFQKDIQIKNLNESDYQITISSITGQVLINAPLTNEKMNLSDLEKGCYVLTLTNLENNISKSAKVIKIE